MIEVVGKLCSKDGRVYFVENIYPLEGTIFAGLKQIGSWTSYHVPVQYLVKNYLGWSIME